MSNELNYYNIPNPDEVENNSNSVCNVSDINKGIAVLYKDGNIIRVINGKIIGCENQGYIVRTCNPNSQTSGLSFLDFHFYNAEYYRTHIISSPNSYPFINIAIRDVDSAFWYFGERDGNNNFTFYTGFFYSYTTPNPTGTYTDLNTFLKSTTFIPRRLVGKLVYYYYIIDYGFDNNPTLKCLKATSNVIFHLDKIPTTYNQNA